MTGSLDRRLGTGDAVLLGVGSMVGAGAFAVWAPAAAAAGRWLLQGLAVAAVVAWCNASSSAALAVRHPTSGGAYVYGREQLGPWWGFAAGWSFVVGKTACARRWRSPWAPTGGRPTRVRWRSSRCWSWPRSTTAASPARPGSPGCSWPAR